MNETVNQVLKKNLVDIFIDIIQAVDRVLREYNLPPFYYPPSYHVSLGWCLGDKVGPIAILKMFCIA
jgi:hypothetical protein